MLRKYKDPSVLVSGASCVLGVGGVRCALAGVRVQVGGAIFQLFFRTSLYLLPL